MKNTQCELILDHLKKGNAINPLQALDKFGCMCLAQRIYNLRNQGHDIADRFVIDKNKKHYKEYYFDI